MLVSSKDKKGKEQRTIEFVPIYLKDRVEKDMESARNYLMEERGLREPKILIKKIKIDTLFKVDGFYMWLSGRTSNQLIFKGANQLILSKEDMKTLKKVVKYIQRQKEDKNVKISVRDGITEEEFGIKYEVLEENFLERLVRYMRIVERLLKKKLFVFVNLRSYLSNQQIDELIKEATYQEIQLLLIETCARDCIEGVTRYIIDKDGCEI